MDSTALHFAAEVGDNSVITYLIDHGAEVNDVNVVSYHRNTKRCELNNSKLVTHLIIFHMQWDNM